MSVNSVNNTLVTGGQAKPPTNSGDVMGKEQFLELLVAQLQNQDPLNPQDPTEFTSQLAQYSQVEQLMNMNTNIESMAGMTRDMEQMSAMGMIGSDVMVGTSTFNLNGSDDVTLGYNLNTTAAEGKLHILNSQGRTVRTFDLSELQAGEHSLTWDGKDTSGATLPAGNYQMSVVTLDADEKRVEAQPLVRTRVTGVDLDPSGHRLVTEAGDYSLAKVLTVLGD